MEQTGLNRRAFLERSGQAAAGAAVVVTTGGITMLMAADAAWAASLEAIDPHDAQVILRALRVMYPHDALGDVYYAKVVAALDEDAKADPEAAALLKDGAGALDGAMPVPFLDLSPGHQHQVLAAMEDSDFFAALRGKTIVVLYNDQRVWQAFGYEGSSWEHGGYLERGFDDLGWLPEPPAEASPPMEL
jgi:hypothetical protein